MWQDTVILAGSIVAIVSLFPTLLDKDASVPLSTSVPTLVVLSGQGVAFYSLDLLGSAVGAAAGFVVWSLIAYYKSPEESGLVPEDFDLLPDDFTLAADRLDFASDGRGSGVLAELLETVGVGSDDRTAATTDSTPAAESADQQSGHAPHAD